MTAKTIDHEGIALLLEQEATDPTKNHQPGCVQGLLLAARIVRQKEPFDAPMRQFDEAFEGSQIFSESTPSRSVPYNALQSLCESWRSAAKDHFAAGNPELSGSAKAFADMLAHVMEHGQWPPQGVSNEDVSD